MSAEKPRLRGLYAITPEDPDTERVIARVRACLEGGAALVQYRAKSLAPALMRTQALALQALCRSHEAPFVVNDALDLAIEIGADGLHLGRDDAGVALARKRFRGFIGVSCYADLAMARLAARDGADYVAIGSVFASSTKPSAVHAPLRLLKEAREASGLPVAAIGGIDASNARDAIAAGADMVAVISALFEARDVREAARSISRLFDPAFPGAPDARAQPRPV